MSQAPPLPSQVVEIERHLKWRVLPAIVFIGLLLALLAIAIVAITMPPRRPRGLPEDARARAAARALSGRVRAETNALRWSTTVLGGECGGRAPDADMLALVEAARPSLDAVRLRHAADPRALAASAALDVVAHAYGRAAARYRQACERAPHFGEARLGAGVALALEADRTPETWNARDLRLQAIAQFAMVDTLEPEYALALFDRALTLREVGRVEEGEYYAALYLARSTGDAHAAALREAFGLR